MLGLRQGDLLGLQPLRTALHDEGHTSAFVKGAIPAGFDGRKMHEHIFAVVALDKSKTFSGVKLAFPYASQHGRLPSDVF
jgi:hypothetical protein